MVTKRWIALVMSVTVLTGCSGSVPKGTAQHRAGCEEAVGQGVAASSSSARLVARANLSAQAQDLREWLEMGGFPPNISSKATDPFWNRQVVLHACKLARLIARRRLRGCETKVPK